MDDCKSHQSLLKGFLKAFWPPIASVLEECVLSCNRWRESVLSLGVPPPLLLSLPLASLVSLFHTIVSITTGESTDRIQGRLH